MRYLRNTSIILSVLILSSCVEQNVVKLHVPDRPEFPVLKQAELECVSQATFNKIAERAELRDSHFKTLEDVIKSTHID